jgi:hypothetical protein
MQRSKPFARALAFMSALADALSMPMAQQQLALATLGSYESRGKGGKRPHRKPGTKANQRQAAKARNVRRNRLAHRG